MSQEESKLRIANSLEVTVNLDNVSFRPYQNTDDIIQYIKKESNHSPTLMKHLPASIEKKILPMEKYLKEQLFTRKINK